MVVLESVQPELVPANVSTWIQVAATTAEELLAIVVIGGASLAALYAFMRSRENDRWGRTRTPRALASW
jgi:hypothetical protein